VIARVTVPALLLVVLLAGVAVGGARASADPADEVLPKGQLPDQDSGGMRAFSTSGFSYAGITSDAAVTAASGTTQVYDPYVGFAAPRSHSLFEVAVVSPDRDIVEVGWIKNLWGSPELFVYHWIDNEGTCYNGCGFVQVSDTHNPGMQLPVDGQARNFSIMFQDGNWWVGYDNDWFGYFPGSEWNGEFTQASRVEWFGEVAESDTPCSDMGNSLLGDDQGAALVSGVAVIPANNGTGWTTPGFYEHEPTPANYNVAVVDAESFRYGGPGAC
jgi:hypothetical protein